MTRKMFLKCRRTVIVDEGFPYKVLKLSPELNTTIGLSIPPVLVRFHNLSCYFYKKKVLANLGQVVGKPVRLDK